MTKFVIKGVEHRAKELKGSISRLRWEIDFVLGQVPGGMDSMTDKQASDLETAMYPLAESMAILQRTIETMDREIVTQRPYLAKRIQTRFNGYFEYFKTFHRVAR